MDKVYYQVKPGQLGYKYDRVNMDMRVHMHVQGESFWKVSPHETREIIIGGSEEYFEMLFECTSWLFQFKDPDRKRGMKTQLVVWSTVYSTLLQLFGMSVIKFELEMRTDMDADLIDTLETAEGYITISNGNTSSPKPIDERWYMKEPNLLGRLLTERGHWKDLELTEKTEETKKRTRLFNEMKEEARKKQKEEWKKNPEKKRYDRSWCIQSRKQKKCILM